MIGDDLLKMLAVRDIDEKLDAILLSEERERKSQEEAEAEAASAKSAAAAAKKSLDDGLLERKKLEGGVKDKEEQARKYAGQQYEVKTNEQYRAILDEIEKAKKEARAIEDRILQSMLKEDEVRANLARLNAEQAAAEKKKKETQETVAANLARFAEERRVLLGERELKAKEMSSTVFYRYERIRNQLGGSPLAKVVIGARGTVMCSSCQMALRPQLVVDVQMQEDFVSCDSCGRLLYIDDKENQPAQG